MGAHRFEEKQVSLPKTPQCKKVDCKMMYKTVNNKWCVTEPQMDMTLSKGCYVDADRTIWEYVSQRMRDRKYGCELYSKSGKKKAAECVNPSLN